MISLQCKMFEDNFKASNFENTELKKSNEDMKNEDRIDNKLSILHSTMAPQFTLVNCLC